MEKSRTDENPVSLPEPRSWSVAISLSGAVLGVVMDDRALEPKNVEQFAKQVRDAVEPVCLTAAALVQVLEARLQAIGCNLDCDRMRTARSAKALCEIVAIVAPCDVVDLFAHAPLETSSSAVRTSLATATEVLDTLEDEAIVSTLDQLAALKSKDIIAARYLQEARVILHQDEMRRSIPLELRMMVSAAKAYLVTGREAPMDETLSESSQRGALPFANTVAHRVEPSKVSSSSKTKLSVPSSGPSASQPRSSKAAVFEIEDEKTLSSENGATPTRVNVERRATGVDFAAARKLLDEAYAEAVEKMSSTNSPMLVSLVVTLDVNRRR
jgi:hypothetical protein